MTKKTAVNKRNQSVRIIGGQWRGRLLPVLDKEGLRPTKDMVRETVFNWLQPRIVGKTCLDCFAGTGALGFEALSRGAAKVILVEEDKHIAKHLSVLASDLDANSQIDVLVKSAIDYLQQQQSITFDIIFLDPPFQLDLWSSSITAIVDKQCLALDGTLYIESSRQQGLPELPAELHYIKEKRSGQVVYGLAEWVD